MRYFSDFFSLLFLVAGVPPLAATNHTVKLTLNKAGEEVCQFFPPTEDRHLNGGYWVQHLVIHNLTGLPNRAHSCSHFDKRSHLTGRRCGQLAALYCQDEKADVGPVARVGCRHTADTSVVMPQTHTHTNTHLTTQDCQNMEDFWGYLTLVNQNWSHPTVALTNNKDVKRKHL